MTYAELALAIADMTPEQQMADVTIHQDNDEYFAMTELTFADDNDVLDDGHPYLAACGF